MVRNRCTCKVAHRIHTLRSLPYPRMANKTRLAYSRKKVHIRCTSNLTHRIHTRRRPAISAHGQETPDCIFTQKCTSDAYIKAHRIHTRRNLAISSHGHENQTASSRNVCSPYPLTTRFSHIHSWLTAYSRSFLHTHAVYISAATAERNSTPSQPETTAIPRRSRRGTDLTRRQSKSNKKTPKGNASAATS